MQPNNPHNSTSSLGFNHYIIDDYNTVYNYIYSVTVYNYIYSVTVYDLMGLATGQEIFVDST